MDFTKQTIPQLVALCKERNIKGYSGKKKDDLIVLLSPVADTKYRVISLFSGMGGMDVGFAEQVTVHRNSVQPDYIESEHKWLCKSQAPSV